MFFNPEWDSTTLKEVFIQLSKLYHPDVPTGDLNIYADIQQEYNRLQNKGHVFRIGSTEYVNRRRATDRGYREDLTYETALMPFGRKYRGKLICRLEDVSYIEWLLLQQNQDFINFENIRVFLEKRLKELQKR